MTAIGAVLVAAALCCWGTLCLLFWQGSWQLLYHPAPNVTRTPAAAGLKFDSIAFAADELGQTRLAGWWIAAEPDREFSRYTVLYLHGQDGNLGDAVDALSALHAAGVNVLAFDYRGYGQSRFVRPSEAHWRQDAEWALEYLAGTRHVAPGSIVIAGDELGANLALEMAAAHPEAAGVIARNPAPDAVGAIFNDARAKLVPARLLVRDRWDLEPSAASLRVPSLWLLEIASPPNLDMVKENSAFQSVSARKFRVWLPADATQPKEEADALSRWLSGLVAKP